MKYSVISTVNGNFKIESEWNNNLSGAKKNFWNKCIAYEDAQDVQTATISIIDENQDVVEGKKEVITHPVAAE